MNKDKMPDEIWVSYFKPFDYPKSRDSPWGVYRINPEQSDSEMTTWGSYIRKDLSVPKKEIEELIEKYSKTVGGVAVVPHENFFFIISGLQKLY